MITDEFKIYDTFVKKGDIVYDIGAHIGKMSQYFIGKCRAKVIYAFEPSPYNFRDLKINCLGFNIKCFQVALHEQEYECETPFKDCKTDYMENGIKLDTIQHIKYVILENFIKENSLELPNFIKLDIEGMESQVLKTFEYFFSDVRPIMYVEIHAQPRNINNQNYENNPHFRFVEQGGFDFNELKKFDYRIIKDDNLTIISEEVNYNPEEGFHGSFVLIPKEKYNL